MDTATIRDRLQTYIQRADSRHLAAIYTLLEKDMELTSDYDAATLSMLYQRRDRHINGESKSYSLEEVFSSIRSSKKG